jgi:hypothetical protein
MNARVLVTITLLFLVAPAVASGQDTGTGFSVQGALGPLVHGGGSSQSLSLGFSPDERIGFVVSAERIHLPTEVTRYEFGYAATRGGTTTFISGEVRVSPFTFNRVTPYALAGIGRGRSRPNVNDLFPGGETTAAGMLFAGGGARLALTKHLSAFADMRFVLQVDRSEAGVFLFLPFRAGLAWRF